MKPPQLSQTGDWLFRRVMGNYMTLTWLPVFYFVILLAYPNLLGPFGKVVGAFLALFFLWFNTDNYFKTKQLPHGWLLIPFLWAISPLFPWVSQNTRLATSIMAAIAFLSFWLTRGNWQLFFKEILLPRHTTLPSQPHGVTPRVGRGFGVLAICLTIATFGPFVVPKAILIVALTLVPGLVFFFESSRMNRKHFSGWTLFRETWWLFRYFVCYLGDDPPGMPQPTRSVWLRQTAFYAQIIPLYFTLNFGLGFFWFIPGQLGWASSWDIILTTAALSIVVAFFLPLAVLLAIYAPMVASAVDEHEVPQLAVPQAPISVDEFLKSIGRA